MKEKSKSRKKIKPNLPEKTRSYSIYLEEYRIDNTKDEIGWNNRFHEHLHQDTVGSSTEAKIREFFTSAMEKFIKRWLDEQRFNLTDYEKGVLK